MKKWMFAFLLLNLTSCVEMNKESESAKTEKKIEKDWSEYKSDSLRFTISFPKGWEARTNGNRIGIFQTRKDSLDDFEETIIIWKEDMPTAIPDSLFAQAAITELKIKNPELRVSPGPVQKLGDRSFHSFTFRFVNLKKEAYQILGYTTVAGQRGFNFSCTSKDENSAELEKTFNQILATFKPI